MALKFQAGTAKDVAEYEQFAQAYRDAKRAMVLLFDAKRKSGNNFSPKVSSAMNDLTMALDEDMKNKRIKP